MKRRKCQYVGCYLLAKEIDTSARQGDIYAVITGISQSWVIPLVVVVVEGDKDVVVWKPVQSGRRTMVSTSTVTVVVGPWSITYVAVAHVVVDVYQVGSMDSDSWQ